MQTRVGRRRGAKSVPLPCTQPWLLTLVSCKNVLRSDNVVEGFSEQCPPMAAPALGLSGQSSSKSRSVLPPNLALTATTRNLFGFPSFASEQFAREPAHACDVFECCNECGRVSFAASDQMSHTQPLSIQHNTAQCTRLLTSAFALGMKVTAQVLRRYSLSISRSSSSLSHSCD
jgi:hypothetical protein